MGIKIVKDTELKDNQFKCDACCMGEDGSTRKCFAFENKHGLGDCTADKHHYVKAVDGE